MSQTRSEKKNLSLRKKRQDEKLQKYQQGEISETDQKTAAVMAARGLHVRLMRDPLVEKNVLEVFPEKVPRLSVHVERDPVVELRIEAWRRRELPGAHDDNGDIVVPLPAPLPIPVSDAGIFRVPAVPRRRHAVVPHKRTYRLALTQQNVEGVEVYSIGAMTDRCHHCGAKFFTGEKAPVSERGRSICCNFAKVALPALNPCPPELRNLLTDNSPAAVNFREEIRGANSLFAMASFKATIPEDRNVNQGAWCFNVCGQIYHFLEPLPSQDNTRPIQNNYYFLDAEDAIQRRTDFVGDRLLPATIALLENLLRRVNPWIASYATMKEVLAEMRQRAGDDVRNVVVAFRMDMNTELRLHDLPTSRSDVAAVFVGEEPPFDVDLRLYPKERGLHHELKNLNRLADPMVYPLLFPHGEPGYDTALRHTYEMRGNVRRPVEQDVDEDGAIRDTRRGVSIREFYAYRLQERDEFSILHNAGKLFQQYIVDAWVRAESNYLWWVKQNQKELRAANYSALRGYLEERAARENVRVGRIVILPSAFVGGPRHKRRKYLDAMTIVARHGKPDLFLTMTCNPKWSEIRTALRYRQKYEHRPDIVCRVFRSKLLELIDDIANKQIFGVALNYMYVIEFQKRGLPHAHILLTLLPEDKLTREEDVDAAVTCVVPDETTEPRLYGLVKTHFLHTSCGPDARPDAACMRDGHCTKGYPKAHSERTVLIGSNAIKQPDYRRPNDGRNIDCGDGYLVDSTRVVPHNNYLAARYDCHLNVECCGSLQTIKYLHKYVEKGPDYVTVEAQDAPRDGVLDWDEVNQYQDYRYVSATEAIWRLFQYQLSDRSHAVVVLPVHLPGEHEVLFDENEDEESIMRRASKPSKLLAWFALNVTDASARQHRYAETPEFYTWQDREAEWRLRRQTSKTLGAIAEVGMREGEKYYLRLLLRVVRGATSFDDVRKVNGMMHPKYEDACRALHLLDDPETYDLAIIEATATRAPFHVRELFALSCVCMLNEGGDLAAVRRMYHRHEESLGDDFVRGGDPPELARQKILHHLCRHFAKLNLDAVATLETLGLPPLTLTDRRILDSVPSVAPEIANAVPRPELPTADTLRPLLDSLNAKQVEAYNAVVEAVTEHLESGAAQNNVFYIDGPAGTGKTFLYNVLQDVATCVFKKTHLAVAWTGMAAALLKNGRTVHNAFRLPLTITDSTVGGHAEGSAHAQRIRDAIFVIWDEAPMASKKAVMAVNRYLKKLMDCPRTMGGKIVIFGGDFRQLLPVMPGAHAGEIVGESLQALPFWPQVVKLRLVENVRFQNAVAAEANVDRAFPVYLRNIGDGKVPHVKMPCPGAPADLVEIPRKHLVNDVHELISFVYDGVSDEGTRAILCPKNSTVRAINETILGRLQGEVKTYYAVDGYLSDPDDDLHIPDDLLNAIETAHLPPFELKLKIGTVVMLLKNVDVQSGLCNGTRLRILEMLENVVMAEVISGAFRGRLVSFPRVTHIASDGTGLPRPMTRKQFPLKLAYAMTINKAQGQTFKRVGLYLETPCFAHGQLYVALSRVGSGDDLKIFIVDGRDQGKFKYRGGRMFTRNVVYGNVVAQSARPATQDDGTVRRAPIFPVTHSADDVTGPEESSEFLDAAMRLETEVHDEPFVNRTPTRNSTEIHSIGELKARVSTSQHAGTSGAYLNRPRGTTPTVRYDSSSDSD